MPATVDTRGLDRLVESWDKLLQRFPEEKRSALDRLGRELLQRVRREIGGSGKVAGWQAPHMGSKGGYSRVGPGKQEVANQYGKKYGYTAAQVTSYLERGHAVPSPTGKSQRYRPNLEKAILGSAGNAVVPGRQFYSYTRLKASDLGIAAMEDELDRLTDEFVDLLAEV